MKRLLILLVLLRNGKTMRCAWEGSSMIAGIAWYKGYKLSIRNIVRELKW